MKGNKVFGYWDIQTKNHQTYIWKVKKSKATFLGTNSYSFPILTLFESMIFRTSHLVGYVWSFPVKIWTCSEIILRISTNSPILPSTWTSPKWHEKSESPRVITRIFLYIYIYIHIIYIHTYIYIDMYIFCGILKHLHLPPGKMRNPWVPLFPSSYVGLGDQGGFRIFPYVPLSRPKICPNKLKFHLDFFDQNVHFLGGDTGISQNERFAPPSSGPTISWPSFCAEKNTAASTKREKLS